MERFKYFKKIYGFDIRFDVNNLRDGDTITGTQVKLTIGSFD